MVSSFRFFIRKMVQFAELRLYCEYVLGYEESFGLPFVEGFYWVLSPGRDEYHKNFNKKTTKMMSFILSFGRSLHF